MNNEPTPLVPAAPASLTTPSSPEQIQNAPATARTTEVLASAAGAPTIAETRAHHPYSPSSLQSLEACPLYRSRQNAKEHERTTAGTRAHNSADTETDDERLSDEDAAAVAECLDYVAELKQNFIKDAKKDRGKVAREARANGVDTNLVSPDYFENRVEEINEPYLPIDDLVFEDAVATTAGYADKIIISHCGTLAHVADYKFGMWPVTEAKTNLQGLAYALGVFKKYPKVQEIIIHFLQPLLNAKTAALVKRSDIPEHYFRISTVVAIAREARKQMAREIAQGLYPSFEQAKCWAPVCSFCDLLGKCPKAAAVAIQVGQKYYPLEVPADITPSMLHCDKDTQNAMRLAMVVTSWAKAFRTVITDRVVRGDAEVPEGFIIVNQSKRELVDLAAYRKAAVKIIGKAAFEETLQTTFGAVEKLIAEKAPRGIKTKVVEQFQKETEESGAVTRGLPITFLKAVPKKNKE